MEKENLAPPVKRGRSEPVRKKVALGKSREHALGRASVSRPRTILVMGRHWSPNVFKNARRAGLSRDRAWGEAFV